MEGNFNDAVKRLNDRKPYAIICPHCGEQRLDQLRPLASGVVYCVTCAAEFEVTE